MSKMKNWMMDIEEFCDGYCIISTFGGQPGFAGDSIEAVVEDVEKFFHSVEAGKYAETYLTTQLGE